MIRTALVLATIIAAACNRHGHEHPPPPTAPAAPATTPAPPTAGAKRIDPSQDVRGLLGRMQEEAANRPSSGITAEQVFDALEHSGLQLADRRQYFGATAKASYCAGGTTRDGIAISVCEYADARRAGEGKRYMDTQFAAMAKHAVRMVHGATVLTIVPPDAIAHAELVQRATRTFRSL